MNLCDIIKEAKAKDRAFRRKGWRPGDWVYVAWGDDGLRRGGQRFDPEISVRMTDAILLADDWELHQGFSYHGEPVKVEEADTVESVPIAQEIQDAVAAILKRRGFPGYVCPLLIKTNNDQGT